MKDQPTVLLCDCEGTMPLGRTGVAKACGASATATQLCGSELGRFEAALATGRPLLVACTQQRALFEEVRSAQSSDAPLAFVNIRERAGWSEEAGDAGPKMAALIAEAALEPKPVTTVSMSSGGVTLVYGRDERAIEAARAVASRLDLTVLLDRPGETLPPLAGDIPVVKGTISRVSGHLGKFELTIDRFAEAAPSSRAALKFGPDRNGARSTCDIIIDLSGNPPLFPAHEARDGYLRADPGNPAAVLDALLKAADLVGEFEKPRYVEYHADICAHSRSRKTGCTRCLEVCPTGAIAPAGDRVEFDPFVCGGCGACAAVCPTGAADYRLPAADALAQRLRTLLVTYLAAGGVAPVLLVHDGRRGAELIDLLARAGRGLPARVLPFAVNEIGQLGLDFFATALAFGAAEVAVLATSGSRHGREALGQSLGLVETLASGLGYGSGRVRLLEIEEPDALGAALYGPALADEIPVPAQYIPLGGKREIARLALRHLHRHAPEPVDRLPLPKGAPYGAVVIDAAGCTLCLACVAACPAGALHDNAERPELTFTESACVQCGLCRNTCPEKVITLAPQIDFTENADRTRVMKEEEPFHCIRCAKPFGTRATIERIIEKLQGKHSMFPDASAIERVRMCGDCRIIAQSENAIDPYAGPARPGIRTADDYAAEATLRDMKPKGEA